MKEIVSKVRKVIIEQETKTSPNSRRCCRICNHTFKVEQCRVFVDKTKNILIKCPTEFCEGTYHNWSIFFLNRAPVILLLLLSISILANGQRMISKAHQYNTRIIGVSGMLTQVGYGSEVLYSKVNKKAHTLLSTLSYDRGQLETTTSYNTVAASFNYLTPIIKDNRSFYMSVGAGPYLAYDMTKNDILKKSKNKFAPGAIVRINAEYFFNKLALFSSIQEVYRPISIVGDWQWRATLGIKYLIN